MKRLWSCAFAISILGVTTAHAQTRVREGKGFININRGYQAGSQAFADSETFSLYGENGRSDTTYRIDRGGGLVDLSGGVRLWRNLAFGVGFSRASSKQVANVAVTVPHPLFFSRARSTTGVTTALDHTETATHLQALWVMAVTNRVEVALSAGPSIFIVKQDVATRIVTREVGPPFDQVTIASIATSKRSETAPGVNVGADITLMVTRQLGGGFFLRYAGASTDLNLTTATVSLDAGGFQVGAGLHVRF